MSTAPRITPTPATAPVASLSTIAATTSLDAQAPTRRRWMHELRNELNAAMMAAAAARQLLQDGDADEALANLRRTESACYRCAQLLREDLDDA